MNVNTTKNLNPVEAKILQYIQDKQLLKPGERVLAGVSGGADSVCLLFVLLSLREYYGGNLHIEVVHVHHMIRGKEADEDMAYVQELCHKHQIPFHCVKQPVEKIAKELGLTVEEAGRKVRYETFEAICREENLHKIAVAHHKDDHAETILMNLFRGSGLKGAAGIPASRDKIIRPLLCISREEIEAYLQKWGVSFRVDSTNLDCDYTRNKVRNQLIPYIEEHINKKATQHLVQFGAYASEIDDYFQKKANILFEKYGKKQQNRVILCLDCLLEERIEVTYLIRMALKLVVSGLKDISHEHIEQIMRIMKGRTGGKCNLPGNVLVEKSYNQCVIRVNKDSVIDRETTGFLQKNMEVQQVTVEINIEQLQENQPYKVSFMKKEFTFVKKKCENFATFPKKKYTKWFDCDKIKFTLQLRTRKSGDFIIINSNGGRKKLKDYFMDSKVAREERDKVLLLAEESELLWITGMRISERYKVDEKTTSILEVCMELGGQDGT